MQIDLNSYKIPFNFIINTTPDKWLVKRFEEGGLPYQFNFYWKNTGSKAPFSNPTPERPVVYNMLGCADQQESMILTHTDLFEYFESIFAGAVMPEKFKRLIKEANNFIFLGLPFRRWYLQLLLRILYIHNDYDFVRYASNQHMEDEIRAFCYEQFNIEFIPNQTAEFLEELVKRCAAAGVQREPQEQKQSKLDQARRSLAEDNIEISFELLLDHLEQQMANDTSDFEDDLLLLQNKYNRLRKRLMRGILDTNEADTQSNRLRVSLLELINDIGNS